MTTWILVSDMSRARLFASELRELEWTLVEEFEHPEGREKSGQIEDAVEACREHASDSTGASDLARRRGR